MIDPTDHADKFRDDITPAFEPSGNGPLTPSLDKWEPFPLHAEFQMPPPRATKPMFVPAAICQRLVDSFGKTDAEFAEAFGVLQEFLEGGPNNNSGARAPIQGDGQ